MKKEQAERSRQRLEQKVKQNELQQQLAAKKDRLYIDTTKICYSFGSLPGLSTAVYYLSLIHEEVA